MIVCFLVMDGKRSKMCFVEHRITTNLLIRMTSFPVRYFIGYKHLYIYTYVHLFRTINIQYIIIYNDRPFLYKAILNIKQIKDKNRERRL